MSSRVAGAGLALIAAALLVVSIATPVALPAALSMYAGHPTVTGHTREAQDVYVGLYDARLCNSGGDGTCKSGADQTQLGFRIVGFGELAVTALGAFALVMLGVMTIQRSEARKGAARLVRIASVIGVAGMVGLIVLSPFGDKAHVPIGLGLILHALGLIGGLVASGLAVLPPPPLVLRTSASKPMAPTPQPMPAQPPARYSPPPQAMGYETEHPAFSTSQQLRPLYEAMPMQNTGPLMPTPPPAPAPSALAQMMAQPAPAMMPGARALFEVDIDVEPSMVAPLPMAPPPAPILPPSVPVPPPPIGQARSKPASVPPPLPARSKPASVPPPLPVRDEVVIAAPPMLAPEPARTIETPFAPPTPIDDAASHTDQVALIEAPGAPGASAREAPELIEAEPSEPIPPPTAQAAAPPAPPAMIAPAARAKRETALPPPKPGLRAAVPMPVRPNRPTMPTRPPPFAMRPVQGKATIAAPVVPPPAIPAIPAIPVIPPVAPPAPRVPVEVTDHGSQTNVSSVADLSANEHAVGDATDASVRISDTSPSGEPVALGGGPTLTTQPLIPASALRPFVIPPAAPLPPPAPAAPPATSTAFPVPIAIPGPTPVVRPAPKLPISTAPDSLPPPKDTKQQSGPSPACPQCESPMAWVEEHLRFYCKSCRMYF
ncbi:MAG TPA: hypothetical protein VFP84_28130 [Kofleriaceae bacterium]|nr:hypothetical protein [Kofleriaceae bacterium]